MKTIEQNRKAVKQLRGLLESGKCPAHERAAVREILIWSQFKLVFRLFEKRLERALNGPFAKAASLKLDAIRVLLDD